MRNDRSWHWPYLFFAFAIAWGTELLLIAMYHFHLLGGNVASVAHYIVLGLGVGMAPAYAAFIAKKKQSGISFKGFCKEVLHTENIRKSIVTLIVFALIQFIACAALGDYLGNPWYLFILFIPVMTFGGGLEEIGWRGVFQPLLESRLPFLVAALIQGVIWSTWHLPLWLVPNTSQGDLNFIAFTLFCITLGLTLAAAYRLTKSIWVTILMHAWSNTLLGMYSMSFLKSFPSIKTLIVYGVQIMAVMLILLFQERWNARFGRSKT